MLRVIHGNRRTRSRSHTYDHVGLNVAVSGGEPVACTIIETSAGRVLIQTDEQLPFSESQPKHIEIKEDGRVRISGYWLIQQKRSDSACQIYQLTLPIEDRLQKYSSLLDPEITYRPNRFRLFDLGADEDLKEVSELFTDLSDFPIPIPVSINLNGSATSGHLNFQARRRELSSIDISVDSSTQIEANRKVILQFTFYSIRYILETYATEHDKDFEILSLSVPSDILSVSARRFDRWDCAVHAVLTSGDRKYEGQLNNISPTGTLFCSSSTVDSQLLSNGNLSLLVPGLNPIACYAASHVDTSIGLRFAPRQEQQVRALFNSTVPSPLTLRRPGNYSDFAELYRLVGYAPTSEGELEKWKSQSDDSWRYQDSILDGNTIGAYGSDNSLTISFSSIPISSTMVYGHSLAMKKSLQGIAKFFDVCNHNLSWCELIPKIEFYSGSARLRSKFSTKLHTVFRYHAMPESHSVFHALAVLPSSTPASNESGLTFELVANPHEHVSMPYKKLVENISVPHPLISERHEISSYLIRDQVGNVAGLAVAHSAPPFFTAANILRCVWVFSFDAASVQTLVDAVLTADTFQGHEVDIFLPTPESPPQELAGSYEQEQIFWYFFHKDDFGPVWASINRAGWSALRKYGELSLAHLERFFS